ncbi:AbgT family transporter [Myxococcota bacterium]|nr:AbgT family transporter [Myxococcota bacterium]MBU1535411.1 AbgT family transporter [Myxococcota bacterium]
MCPDTKNPKDPGVKKKGKITAGEHETGSGRPSTGEEGGVAGAGDAKNKKGRLLRWLDRIERVGNALPHPATIFAILAALVVLVSFVAHLAGWSAIHPTKGTVIRPFNLLSFDGIRYMYLNVTKNFILFPPFGIVLVAMIGIGVAEGTGLIEALIRQSVVKAPRRMVTSIVIAAGILSHLASSVGYVVLIPLGAMVFIAFNRHPIAGIAAAFVGVSGGFGANFLIGSIDPILAGLSESAARMIDPAMSISPAVNYYFMVASAILIVLVGTFVTERIVEPRLGPYKAHMEKISEISPIEKRGLFWALIAMLSVVGLFLVLVVPQNGLLHGDGQILKGPFFKGLITAILIFFFVPGFVYGVIVRSIKNDRDVIKLIIVSMKGIAPYIVLVFFAAQFVFWFKESNLGIILAIKGANLIKSSGVSGVVLIIIFILFSAILNMFMGSASAKWAIMAPVFVPMFMLSGYHPALTQAAFRIGDSVTNIITPMMSYFALIITFVHKYDKNAGIGTMIATMLPYTIYLSLAWVALIVLWYLLGIPLGPGGPLRM